MAVLDVNEFGADPTGVNDSLPAVQAAADASQNGDTIFFPFGHYRAGTTANADKPATVKINRSFITVKGPARLKNFMFEIRGSFGASYKAIDAERSKLSLEQSAPLRRGDKIQLVSNRNAFLPSSASLQGGSISPSTGILYDVRYSEFATVSTVENRNVAFTQDLIFDSYRPEEISHFGASFRVARMLRRVSFRDLTFDMETLNYFRTLQFSATADCSVVNCEFVAGELPGRHVMVNDSLRLSIDNCISSRQPAKEARGSSWNSFVFGAGCQECAFTNNKIYGDWQAVDFTSYGDDKFVDARGIESSWRTTQRIKILNNFFSNCHDGITTHPGTYYAQLAHNVVEASTSGSRVRSRNNVIVNNRFSTTRYGLIMSSYFNDTLVSGNIFTRDHSKPKEMWAGIGLLFTSRESFTTEGVNNVSVIANQVRDPHNEVTSFALQAFHQNLATLPNETLLKISESPHAIEFKCNDFNDLPAAIDGHLTGLKFK